MTQKRIFIVNGAPMSGKTTFEQIGQEILGRERCDIMSIIDSIKEIARSCGWRDTKGPEDRRLLSDLKDALDRWNQYSIKKIEEAIDKSAADVIFVDCREPYDIRELVDYYGDQVKTILITAAGRLEKIAPSNHADANVEDYAYDYVIENNGTYSDLRDSVETFFNAENI